MISKNLKNRNKIIVKPKMPSSTEPDSSVRIREKGKLSALKHAETISDAKRKTRLGSRTKCQ